MKKLRFEAVVANVFQNLPTLQLSNDGQAWIVDVPEFWGLKHGDILVFTVTKREVNHESQ